MDYALIKGLHILFELFIKPLPRSFRTTFFSSHISSFKVDHFVHVSKGVGIQTIQKPYILLIAHL
jgi:hypothetical protein